MIHFSSLLEVKIGAFFENAKNAIASFDFVKDTIEILLLSIILFVAFRFIKGRKAGALIVGIIICIAILVLAELFQFTVIHSIFSGIIGSGAIVILIIFQPELRDALERIGNGSINGIMSFSDRRKKKELYNKVIDNVCEAVSGLSADMTGALIVIERTTGLSDITQEGITLNADVSSHLLRNLFFNKAPLHDGAVVIADGKIAAAGCFLPLTRRTDVAPELGTRHRAAIGMSECSDAVIIVVSEETGALSIAHDCTLLRDLSVDQVKSYLMEKILRVSGNSKEIS